MSNSHHSSQTPDQRLADIASKRQAIDAKLTHLGATITSKFKTSLDQKSQGLHARSDHIKKRMMSSRDDYLRLTEEQIDQIKAALKHRQTQVQHALNVKRHAAKHPYLMIGAAVATGIAVGAFVGKGRPLNTQSLTRSSRSLAEAFKTAAAYTTLATKDILSAGDRVIASALVGAEEAPAQGFLGSNLKQALSELARDRLSQWTQARFPELAPAVDRLVKNIMTPPQEAAEPSSDGVGR